MVYLEAAQYRVVMGEALELRRIDVIA